MEAIELVSELLEGLPAPSRVGGGRGGGAVGLTGRVVAMLAGRLALEGRGGIGSIFGLVAATGGGRGALPFLDLVGDGFSGLEAFVAGRGDGRGDGVTVTASGTLPERQTGTRSVLMSTADCKMGLDIWRVLRVPLSGGFGGPSKLFRDAVGDDVVGSSLPLVFAPNFDLILDALLLSSVGDSTLSLTLADGSFSTGLTGLGGPGLSGLASSSMWQMTASENSALGSVDHLGVKVADGGAVAGGGAATVVVGGGRTTVPRANGPDVVVGETVDVGVDDVVAF